MEWDKAIFIDAPIEVVWNLFSDENIQRIMPNVIEHTLLEKKENEIGSTYKQKYREGRRIETYILEITAYEDQPTYKYKTTQFVLAKSFRIETTYSCEVVEMNKTKLVYKGKNEGLNIFIRALLKLSSLRKNQKVVDDFLEKVKAEAEKDITTI